MLALHHRARPRTRRAALLLAAALVSPLVAALPGLAAAPASAAVATPNLPIDLPDAGTLRSSPRKVFAHYVPTMPVSFDNQATDSDYYARNYLRPDGEGGVHKSYGGLLRDRPLGRPVRAESTWADLDAQAEVRQAIAAGLDGFTLVVYGLPNTTNNAVWERTERMMRAAAAVDPGFKIIVQPDLSGTLSSVDAATLAKHTATLTKYSSSFKLGDGRVVVSPFHAETHSASWWASYLSILKNTYGQNVAFVPTFLDDQANRDAFAPITYGMGNWGNRTPAWNDPDVTTSTSAKGRISAVHALGDIWMQPVSVQDSRPRAGKYWESENLENLRRTWRIAIEGKAEWVQLATWSDYSENSQMAPSIKHGWSFLDASAYYLQWFKTGVQPAVARDAVYLTHRLQPNAAKPSYPQTLLMTKPTIGGSTPRDTIEAMTFAKAPSTVTIKVGTYSTSCSVPAGPGVCTVPLHSGTPSVTMSRSGVTVSSLTSPFSVTSTPYVQDLMYVGSSSLRQGSTVAPAVAPTPTTGTSSVLTPLADSYANQGAPSTNYGSDSTLSVRGSSGATSYLRFALPAAPTGKTLTKAVLRLRTQDSSIAGSAESHKVTLASSQWTETGLTWNNRPALWNALGTIPAGTAPGREYQVTLDANALKAALGTQTTIGLSNAGTDSLWLWSREHANSGYRPALTLTWS